MLFKPIFGIAQDTIYRFNGDTISAKIIAVNIDDIKYKRSSDSTGPTYTVLRSTVKSIVYNNGARLLIDGNSGEAIPVVIDSSALTSNPQPSQMELEKADSGYREIDESQSYLAGQQDAKAHYKKYKKAALLTLSISLVSPLVGLVPAFICSLKSPAEKNLDYPDKHKMANNKVYAKSYLKAADKIKQNKVWMAWVAGLGVNYGLFILLGL